jgi:hypothetical protein
MAELERMANHFGDIGAICNDASFALMLAHCGVLRERVLRFAGTAFGHRLMMDMIVPGGATRDRRLSAQCSAGTVGAIVPVSIMSIAGRPATSWLLAEMPPAKIAATPIKASMIGTKAASLLPSGRVSIGSISSGIKMSFRNFEAMRTTRD